MAHAICLICRVKELLISPSVQTMDNPCLFVCDRCCKDCLTCSLSQQTISRDLASAET